MSDHSPDNKHWLWVLIGALALVCLSFCGGALAAASGRDAVDVIKIELEFKPDLRHGRSVYEICASCHLPEGWGNHDGTYPQLAGQHRSVLMRQLLAIRTGKRENPIMYPFVQERTIGNLQSLADVVAYISRLPMDPDHGRGPWWDSSPEFQSGKSLYEKHCRSCHGGRAQGYEATATPRLQGQHYAYLLRQIGLIRGGERKVNPDMTRAMAALSADQLKLIINYVSWLPVPKADLAPSRSWRNSDFAEE
ncbi:MAG TPA: c-type cytochrome [Gammaproteobacteria bacterium]|nr:c-type cytochrome [Gammaproteobacteria bacterium]